MHLHSRVCVSITESSYVYVSLYVAATLYLMDFLSSPSCMQFEVCVWSIWAGWCICSLSKAAVLWMCVCVSTELFFIPSVYCIWSSSHAAPWPLTPGALSRRSFASVSAGACQSPPSSWTKTRVVYFTLLLYAVKRKPVSFAKLELCDLP